MKPNHLHKGRTQSRLNRGLVRGHAQWLAAKLVPVEMSTAE